jgi:hypothetical protein
MRKQGKRNGYERNKGKKKEGEGLKNNSNTFFHKQ